MGGLDHFLLNYVKRCGQFVEKGSYQKRVMSQKIESEIYRIVQYTYDAFANDRSWLFDQRTQLGFRGIPFNRKEEIKNQSEVDRSSQQLLEEMVLLTNENRVIMENHHLYLQYSNYEEVTEALKQNAKTRSDSIGKIYDRAMEGLARSQDQEDRDAQLKCYYLRAKSAARFLKVLSRDLTELSQERKEFILQNDRSRVYVLFYERIEEIVTDYIENLRQAG